MAATALRAMARKVGCLGPEAVRALPCEPVLVALAVVMVLGWLDAGDKKREEESRQEEHTPLLSCFGQGLATLACSTACRYTAEATLVASAA